MEVCAYASQGTARKKQHRCGFWKSNMPNFLEVKMEKITTGFAEIDAIIGGFPPAYFIIVASRPGVGKTALAIQIARHVACVQGLPVAYFSLEMTKDELAQRFLGPESSLSSSKLQSDDIAGPEWARLTMSAGKLAETPIFIDDTPRISVADIQEKARRLQSKQGLGLVIVDYLQLMGGLLRNRCGGIRIEPSEIACSFKTLATELQVPIIVLAQLPRPFDDRAEKRPCIANLQGMLIEPSADIILICREKQHVSGADACNGDREIIICKNRNGAAGSAVVKLF
jgi:replicative DNA helicase